MESIDNALARTVSKSEREHNFSKPIINSVDDIRRVLHTLDPSNKLNERVPDTVVAANIYGTDGKTNSASVSTKTKSYRDMLIEGLGIVRSRINAYQNVEGKSTPLVVNNKEMVPPCVVAMDTVLSIDPVISRLLGASRDGYHITWRLPDGFVYKYDIFEHRLTRDAEGES